MDKNVDKRANSPWAIMDVLVRYRHELEEMIGPEKPIGTNSNGLQIRYASCLASTVSIRRLGYPHPYPRCANETWDS